MYFKILLVVICCFHSNNVVEAHGRLIDPPSRSSMWRFGFNTPKNYNDNQLFCGGAQVQNVQNDGKCGFCGDPYDGDRLNEAGGKYATGTIAKTYNQGSTIDVVVQITANHKGWSQFKLCKNDNYLKKVTQECLDKHLLPLASDPSVTRHNVSEGDGFKEYKLQLPKDLTCSQCVLQWQYHTGNSYGYENGKECPGCGRQEEFYGCSDIAIKDSSGTPPPPPPTTLRPPPPPTTTTSRPPPPTTTTKTTTITTTTVLPTTKSPSTAPSTKTPQQTGMHCYAYPFTTADDTWCNNSCKHVPPHCPKDFCYCKTENDAADDVQTKRLRSLIKALLHGSYRRSDEKKP